MYSEKRKIPSLGVGYADPPSTHPYKELDSVQFFLKTFWPVHQFARPNLSDIIVVVCDSF